MGGHSHWSQIKRQKGGNDAKRGNLFTKLSREVTVSAREGGGDPSMNPRLRLAIEKARYENMPADTIKRAIERGAGGGEAAALQEIMFEGYGPGGVAILIQALTDNRNRTVSELRTTLTRGGGSLGESGMTVTSAELAMLPKNTTPLDEKVASQALKLLDQIEELDDVQKVYSNAEFPDTVLMEYAAG
jgi:YebC/PmpR family DNA-binding regulatory protein